MYSLERSLHCDWQLIIIIRNASIDFPPKLDKSVPTLLLGGGGYNAQLTARLWTTLTAAALRAPALGPEIPADDQVDIKEYQHQLIILYVLPGTFFALQFFLEYGPSYEFEVNASGRAKWTDHNSQQHLQRIRETAKGAHKVAAFQRKKMLCSRALH